METQNIGENSEMGTNFYLKEEYVHLHPDADVRVIDEPSHIGKRSGAGPYCWSCQITLCRGGNTDIHTSKGVWDSVCPICGNGIIAEDIRHSSAGRELGFNKTVPHGKSGVKSCSSFTWDMAEENVNIFKHDLSNLEGCIIEDEYGREFTYFDFEDILLECPVVFYKPGGGWD